MTTTSFWTHRRWRFQFLLSLCCCLLLTILAIAEEVSLIRSSDGTFEVPIVINDTLKLNFTLDTGASVITITPDLLMTLIRSGTITEVDVVSEQSTYVLANGSTVTGSKIILKEVTIGNTTLKDVEAAVFHNLESGLLLGQSFLGRLPGWSIDNGRGVLVINESTKRLWREGEEFSVEAGSDWSRDTESENGDPFIFAMSDEAGGGYIGVIEIEEDSGARQLAQSVLASLQDDFEISKEEWFEVFHADTNEAVPATIFTVKPRDNGREGYVATFRYGGWSYVLMGFWDLAVYEDYPQEIFKIMESFKLHWTPD